jgi:ParB-like chromosome segregation protein Spo0J
MDKKRAKINNKMEYKNIKIKDVKVAGYNPRKISSDEMEKLKSSLQEFGCVRPLVINKKTGNLVAGHQMLEAAKQLGWKELPYIEIDLEIKNEKALNVAMNKLSGEWNYELLGPLLSELNEGKMLDLTGFDSADLELMEGFSDTGGLMEEGVLDPMKDGQVHELTFKFADEIEMKKVEKFFKTKQYKWKDKGLNSNQLIKLVEKIKNDNKT